MTKRERQKERDRERATERANERPKEREREREREGETLGRKERQGVPMIDVANAVLVHTFNPLARVN